MHFVAFLTRLLLGFTLFFASLAYVKDQIDDFFSPPPIFTYVRIPRKPMKVSVDPSLSDIEEKENNSYPGEFAT